MTLSGSNLFSLFFPLIFNPFEQSVVSSAAATVAHHLFWSEKTILIELDWVTLCEVELVNTARLVNTGVMTTACTPWPPSCPRFNQHPHMAIYTHQPRPPNFHFFQLLCLLYINSQAAKTIPLAFQQ